MENKETGFNIDTDALDDNSREDAKVLLQKRDEILDSLATHGMHADDECPYAYYIPTGLSFECGRGEYFPMRSHYAVLVMARASYARARFLDVDREGCPELPQFCGGEEGFQRVYITDPFAMFIDNAIKRQQEKLLAEGKARIVNGRFFKVA